MNATAFESSFDPSSPKLIYLFCPGKAPRAKESTFEQRLADKAIEHVTNALIMPDMRDFCYNVFHADEADEGEIVSVCQTLPFLAERRVVVVMNAERFEAATAGEAMLYYLKHPSPSTVLLLVAPKIDKRLKFYKACAAVAEIVECGELGEDALAKFVTSRVAELGKKINGSTVNRLLKLSGTRISDVENAVNVVADYVGAASEIKEADVQAACADVAEEIVWDLTDAIAKDQVGDAVRALRKLIDAGKSEPEIMGTINWLLKTAHAVSLGKAAAKPVAPFLIGKYAPLARKLKGRFPGAFALCMKTELMLRSTGVDKSLALEMLVIKLAMPLKSGTPTARKRSA